MECMLFLIVYLFEYRTTADCKLVLGVSRALLLLSRNLLITAVQTRDVSVVDNVLEFVWTHLEHHMDSVRHSASGILLNLVKLGSSLQQDGMCANFKIFCLINFVCCSKSHHILSYNVKHLLAKYKSIVCCHCK
jgi:hypothetical protein